LLLVVISWRSSLAVSTVAEVNAYYLLSANYLLSGELEHVN
jgi:hypothetical protein